MSDACCSTEGAVSDDVEEPPRLLMVREIQLAAISGLLLAGGIAAELSGAHSIETGLFAAALIAGGSTFIPDAFRNLLRRKLGVGTLMAIAAIGAVILGELGEAAMLAFLFSISEALESYALTKTRRGLRALLDLAPPEATLLQGGLELRVGAEQLKPGDRILIRPGERVATDGVITSGHSSFDFSAITGESVAVELEAGQKVFAAAINEGSAIEIDVTASASDNSLARIVEIVEEAQERKSRSQRFAERVAKPLVPGVLVVAFLVAVAGSLLGEPTTWIERSLVVLVAAAPCAFAISVPVTVVAAIGASTRSGVLIKGGAALEALSEVRTVALDKTGTLTRNSPQVMATLTVAGVGEKEVLRVAGALERRSEHPLAPAILAASGPVDPAEDTQTIPGSGLTGTLEGREVRLGRPGFIEPRELGHEVTNLQDRGSTVVLVEREGELIGAIAVRDELRPEARTAVDRLTELGMTTAVLTGDNARTGEAIAREAGISDVYAELLPTDKVKEIERLAANAPTSMVGDGVNDAPALATSNVGIAMGAMGTDVAIEAADVALMGDDLRHLPATFAHARRAGRIMKQNLLLSGGILVALVPLAASGALGLAAVVAVHELAEILVIANGVRAGRAKAFSKFDRPRSSRARTANDRVIRAGANSPA
jgi:cation-transporting ATPase G